MKSVDSETEERWATIGLDAKTRKSCSFWDIKIDDVYAILCKKEGLLQMEKEQILSYLFSIKSKLLENGIEKIGLFGSFEGDSADLYRDIDRVIKTTPKFVEKFDGVTGFLFLEDLREDLKKKFHKPVDICDESGLKHKEIIKDAIYA